MSKINPHIERAIRFHGSQAKLARVANCSQQYVSLVLRNEIRVSAEMAIAFDRATEGSVSKHELRPDIFGPGAGRAA